MYSPQCQLKEMGAYMVPNVNLKNESIYRAETPHVFKNAKLIQSLHSTPPKNGQLTLIKNNLKLSAHVSRLRAMSPVRLDWE